MHWGHLLDFSEECGWLLGLKRQGSRLGLIQSDGHLPGPWTKRVASHCVA
jgi:hypothetical protein